MDPISRSKILLAKSTEHPPLSRHEVYASGRLHRSKDKTADINDDFQLILSSNFIHRSKIHNVLSEYDKIESIVPWQIPLPAL